MTTVYLVRHAEAEGNLYRRAQGHFNGEVTPMGEKQIEALTERFRDIPLDAVYSSDLTRAHETALGVAAPTGLPVTTMRELREINLGIWENKPFGELEADEAEAMYNFTRDPAKWSVEGGESFPALTERITSALLELAKCHDGGTIAVVSHGMAIRSLLCHALGLPGSDHHTVRHGDNTNVSLLHIEGNDISVEYFNDNSHLPEEISTFARQLWWKAHSESDRGNLRFVPLNPAKEPHLYTGSYRDAWFASHGTEEGFVPGVYLKSAKKHAKENPASLVKAMRGNEFSGVVELDIHRGEEIGSGWITLLYLISSARSRNLGVQLLGYAVFLFREMGRKSIRLHVSEDNDRAIAFYKRAGFKMIGVDEGVLARLYLMEKSI